MTYTTWFWLGCAARSPQQPTHGVLLVGESNPLSTIPVNALFPSPPNSAGARLQRYAGLSQASYLALWRTNLCGEGWSTRAAADRADELLWSPDRQWEIVVMLGRKVAKAFEYDGPFFSSARVEEGPIVVSVPHPSGLCREWNDATAPARFRDLMRGVAPAVPWGERV